MKDTSRELERFLADQYARLPPVERVELGIRMFDMARTLFEFSLPPSLTEYERKRRITERFYGREFADLVFPVR